MALLLMLSSFSSHKSNLNDVMSNEKGIRFEQISFQEALKKAKVEDKLIFVDAYAVWCGPCKLMDRTTFKSEEVGKVFNQYFINLKIDMEKGEGLAIAKKYMVRAYPTLMFINSEGKLVKRVLGAMSDKELLKEINDLVQ